MKILVLGGTTFLGKEIVKELCAAGHSVTLFTRGNARPRDLPATPHILGDRYQEKDLKKAADLGNWDLIIDNLAYCARDVELVLKAFPIFPRYLLTSTISVYRYAAEKTPRPFREESVMFNTVPKDEDLKDVHWKYARGKWEAEKILRSLSKASWTIFRPTMVYGPFDPKDRGFWYLSRLLDGAPLLLPDSGLGAFQFAFSSDVGKAYRWAVESPVSMGKTYNLANPEILTLKEFLKESADALKVRPSFLSIPSEHLSEMGGPLAMDRPWILDLSAFQKDSGFSFGPANDHIRSTALWFKENWKGDLRKIKGSRDEEIHFAERWKNATKALCS